MGGTRRTVARRGRWVTCFLAAGLVASACAADSPDAAAPVATTAAEHEVEPEPAPALPGDDESDAGNSDPDGDPTVEDAAGDEVADEVAEQNDGLLREVRSATPGRRATIRENPCLPALDDIADRADCFRATMPEARVGSEVRGEVEIALARIHAEDDTGLPPVLFVDGGPGAATLDHLSTWWEFSELERWAADRDVIVFDARGVGLSSPLITCEAIAGLRNRPTPFTHGELVKRLETCRDQMDAAAFDPRHFNAFAMADDIEDIRRLLEIDEWFVLGTSYGTKVAVLAADRHPSGVSGLILDSVLPTDEELVFETRHAVEALALLCHEDDTCARDNGDVLATYDEVIDDFRDNPITTDDGLVIGHRHVDNLVFNMMYNAESASTVPSMLDRLAERPPGVDRMIDLAFGGLNVAPDLPQLVVMCNSDLSPAQRRWSVDDTEQVANSSMASTDGAGEYCDALELPTPLEGYDVRVVPSKPSVVLGGGLDPVTPADWGRDLARDAPRARFVEFPEAGHGVLAESFCAEDVVTAFLADPGQPLDIRCVASDRLLDFEGEGFFGQATQNRSGEASEFELVREGSDEAVTLAVVIPEQWVAFRADFDANPVDDSTETANLLLFDDENLPTLVASVGVLELDPDIPLAAEVALIPGDLIDTPDIPSADEVLAKKSRVGGEGFVAIVFRKGTNAFFAAVFLTDGEIPPSFADVLNSLEVVS